MKMFSFFQITPQIDFQIHPATVTTTSEIISEPITTPQNVSKPIVKTTPPKDKKKVSFNQQPIAPKIPMSPKVIELPEVVASTVISIENQNLLDQGKSNPSFPINYGTRTIISRGLYAFYPIFYCSLYCRAVYNAERLIFPDFFSSKNG